jgi:phosphohistidine swiveling domain-containing protein
MGGYDNEGVLYAWDEERDLALLDKYKVWICDRKETTRCFTPFDLWMIQHNYDNHGIPYAADYLAVPECKGCDWRIKDGWLYVTSIPTTDEEFKEREPRFNERIAPWIEDFGKEYHEGVEELTGLHNKIKAVDCEKVDDWELKDAFRAWLWTYRREADIHFIWMYAFCIIYSMFEDKCKELLRIDRNDRLFNDMLGGFDHKILQTDRELFRLGSKAREMDLEPVFQETPEDEELLSKLESTETGKRWLQELRNFVDEYGWRTIGNWDAGNPSWVEKPSMALPSVRRFMAAPTFAVDEARQGLVERRTKAEKEVISRLPTEKRGDFAKLMKAAQWAGVVDEEHVFYAENYGSALGRYLTKEIGKRFAAAGTIDDPRDLYYMLPEEIEPRMFSKYSAKKLVEERKKQHLKFRREEPEPFIGNPSKLGEVLGSNPLLRSTIAPNPRVRPELKADLYGTVSTPGVVEGVVNLIESEDDFDKFEPRSILVAIETSSAWTPLFNMAKAVVTDVGGVLSHAAIVGREYGLPVISGCVEGTKKLRTGMKIRVDGDAGVIYILEK